jgi:hypothetical protein
MLIQPSMLSGFVHRLTGISGTTSYGNNDTFSLVGELPEAFKSLTLVENM